MRLYRGQPTAHAVAEAAGRRPEWLSTALADRDQEPMLRASGRWFTDDMEIARWYVGDANGAAEIVAVDVPDALAETFRVSNTPVTPCGLSPGIFSRDPEHEFLLPRDLAEQAVTLSSDIDAIHPVMDNSPFGGKIMADGPITYEGMDTRAHEAEFLKNYAIPGDKLRVDPTARIQGVDTEDLVKSLGTDPLTVSKTVMTGEDAYVRPEYEFEGVKGRFSARAFQHELGESGMHGVVAMRDGEMWAVPMKIDGADMVATDGPAREIVGFAGKRSDEIHPEGLDGLRKELQDGPFQVDLYHRNAISFDDKTGPVNVVAMPMTYGSPSDQEFAIASKAIDEAAFEKRIGEVARDSEALLKNGGLNHEDGRERSEITDLVDALDARRRQPSAENNGRVLDAAEATLGMLDDNGLSNRPSFDKLAYSVEAAGRAGDALLRSRYSDLGLEPAAARQMESLAKQHDDGMDDSKTTKPNAAAAGAAMAAMAQRSM